MELKKFLNLNSKQFETGTLSKLKLKICQIKLAVLKSVELHPFVMLIFSDRPSSLCNVSQFAQAANNMRPIWRLAFVHS